MTSPFARVEPKDGGKDEDGMVPYYKLIAANMVLHEGFSEDELQEMADILNARVKSAVEEAVKSLKIELEFERGVRTAMAKALNYYESALCVGDLRIALHGGGDALAINPERVSDVLKERETLKADLAGTIRREVSATEGKIKAVREAESRVWAESAKIAEHGACAMECHHQRCKTRKRLASALRSKAASS